MQRLQRPFPSFLLLRRPPSLTFSSLPSTQELLLLSLLHHHHHQPNYRLYPQILSQLIATAIHISHMSPTGILIWNSLIRHYSLSPSFSHLALHLYSHILRFCAPNPPTNTFTFTPLLKASSLLPSPLTGAQLHCTVIKKSLTPHLYIDTSLISMYSAFRRIPEAEKVFAEMPHRNPVSWNAIITGLARWGCLGRSMSLFYAMPCPNVVSWTGLIDGLTRARRPLDALLLFRQMSYTGVNPTEITVLALIPSISALVSLKLAEALHCSCEKTALTSIDVRVENSLIDMYAKCGAIENSAQVFRLMGERRNLVSWTSVVSGLAMHGMASEARATFDEMRTSGIEPNRVTFLSMLSACAHGGLVEEGLRFFSCMVHECGVEPDVKHYGCVIDMLGRVGRLGEAEEIIGGMPMEVSAVVWRTLLGCCSKHGELEMGERVMRRIEEMEKEFGGDYVVLSNMLSEAGRFADAHRVRGMIDERKMMKVPGVSMIGGKV